jgi:hypothetical protein
VDHADAVGVRKRGGTNEWSGHTAIVLDAGDQVADLRLLYP